jgi:hypothetical protein
MREAATVASWTRRSRGATARNRSVSRPIAQPASHSPSDELTHREGGSHPGGATSGAHFSQC